MRRRTKKSAVRAKPGNAAAKLGTAPARRGQAAKPKRQAAAAQQIAPAKPRRNGTAPDKNLARLRAELDEARAQQSATAEILQIINRSAGDPAPAFDAILERAMRLCDAAFGGLLVIDGEFIKYVTFHNVPERFKNFLMHNRVRPRTMFGPGWETGTIVNISDLSRSEPYRRRIPVTVSAVEDGGIRAMLLVPMMREGAFVGAFTIYRQEVRPFTDREIALARSFADQAAIAMENARLLTETREALEKQTATAEILRVISASPTDLQPTFDAIADQAKALFGAVSAGVFTYDGSLIHVRAHRVITEDESDAVKAVFPLPPSRATAAARAVLTREVAHIVDPKEDLDFAHTSLTQYGTVLAIPMVREDKCLGVIALTRQHVEPFTGAQIELLKTFADQAVIAIENVRLFGELRARTDDLQESLEYQTATSDVLKVISRSTFDLQPVLDTLTQTAGRLCDADNGALAVRDGEVFRIMATYRVLDDFVAFLKQRAFAPGRGTIVGRVALEGEVVHIDDIAADADFEMVEATKLGKVRTHLGVPLLREGVVVGAFVLARHRVEAFTERQIELVRTFADQAVIAMENARLINETREALEKQTATAEILRVISGSPTDLQPTMDAIAARATRLTGAATGHVFTYDGALIHHRSHHGSTKDALDAIRAVFPAAPSRGSTVSRAILTREVAHVVDPKLDAEFVHAGLAEYGTVLSIPMLRDGNALGAITVVRHRVEGFTEAQIDLLKTFADQAVIAIENVRLFTELRATLDRETASAEILRAIASAPGDATRSLQAIAETTVRLFGASRARISMVEGGELIQLAMAGNNASTVNAAREAGAELVRHIGTDILNSVVIRENRQLHAPDLEHPDPAFADWKSIAPALKTGTRTVVMTPLSREGKAIGVLICTRDELKPFTAPELAQLTNFADQAVIAIENARLLSELRESLDRQTATADVLQVINGSPGELAPVFDTMVRKALELCGAAFGGFWLVEGGSARAVSMINMPEQAVEFLMDGKPTPVEEIVGANFADRPYIQASDLREAVPYRNRAPLTVAAVELAGIRTFLAVPLRKEGLLVGIFAIYRQEVRPFSNKQIAVVQSFAEQAVIAIENARLLTELRESLERQTATAEVLQVINASPGNLAPVFAAILEEAHTLCGASRGALFLVEGDTFHAASTRGYPDDLDARLRIGVTLADGPLIAPLIEGARMVHFPDLLEVVGENDPGGRAVAERGGVRTNLLLPLRKDGKFMGFISCNRTEVRPFAENEIALLESFAAQAVIAIENARLLTELRESLERQTATAEILSVISTAPGELQSVYDKILECALRFCHAHMGHVLRATDGVFTQVADSGGRAGDTALTDYRPPPESPLGQMVAAKATIQIRDYAETEAYIARAPGPVLLVEVGGARSAMQVPLLNDREVVGAITLFRPEVRPFDEKEVALVESFAAQAVIAIENARLLTELRESLDRQTATADILRAIASTPGDPTHALDAIAETALRMFGAANVGIRRLDGDMLHYVATAGRTTGAMREQLPARSIDSPDFFAGAARENRQFHVPDMQAELAKWPPDLQETLRRGGIRTAAFTPLTRDGKAIGAMGVNRTELRPFRPDELELMKGFADQAVIAIENARLLTELRESLEQQQAMAEVLQVINASPGNLAPVYDVILEKAHTLCGAARGSLQLFDGEEAQIVAARGHISVAVGQRLPAAFPPFRRLAAGESFVEIPDMRELDDPIGRGSAAHGTRTMGLVPLRKENTLLGVIVAAREEVRPFTEKQIALLQSFAAQAVIAMDNARLLTELRESLEQQQAMAEVLRAINSSPGNLTPVFDAILEKAHILCGASRGALYLADGNKFRAAVTRGYPADIDSRLRDGITMGDRPAFAPLLEGARIVHQPDLLATLRDDDPVGRAMVERGGVRSNLFVPLRQDGRLLGFISCNRAEARPFSEKEIALLESFAAQAVIAMDNARLLEEIRQRQAELRVTFENMGDAVIMFDGAQRLVAWNRNFLNMLDIPEEWLANPRTYADFAAYLTERGEFGDAPPPDIGAPDRGEVRPIRYERTRPDGRVLEVRRNPIPGGAGFVFIYADITERKLAEQSILAAREAAERALGDLKLAQANLVQAEKMASLGQLTAGIAHEIKNPLNFVNNFANLSNELLGELKETAAPAFATLDADKRDEVDETMAMLTGNLEKIQEHGRRADGIVKSMLAHSRGGSGERREADINALVEESLNLAYHGARAQDQNFNITLERDYDKSVAPIELVPQDVTRVFLNLCGNGFYAANKRRKEGGAADFRPVLKVATRDLGDAVEVRIRDNGTGIPPEIRDKLFQPFFTTKPTGEGTGLGLSISYDIVTQQHGGTIEIDSRVGDFTEFTIHLPRKR